MAMSPMGPREHEEPEGDPPPGLCVTGQKQGEHEGECSEADDEDYAPTDPGDEGMRMTGEDEDLFANENDGEKKQKESKAAEDAEAPGPGVSGEDGPGVWGEDFDFTCQPCDARDPKILASPCKPTAEDIEKHFATHLLYRSWCPVCVKTEAKEDDHKWQQNCITTSKFFF